VNEAIDQVLEAEVAGNPQTGHLWVRQSLKKLCIALEHILTLRICCETLRRLLKKRRIGLKSNVKRLHPKPSPDRDKQFQYITEQRANFRQAGLPIISVDTKKKELLGPFFNRGKQWCTKATEVYTHDFPSYAEGKAIPYGIYDVTHNRGYVAVNTSADTPEFAVDAIVWWWKTFGLILYPGASALLILADGGGSNGYRPRRWKQLLQEKMVDAFGLEVTVCHYPTGASKWNPIEHRLFSQISRTWAGTPLTSQAVVLEALTNTHTSTGLIVEATLFDRIYEKALSVSDADMNLLNLQKHSTCPNWNYSFRPRKQGSYL
jgi:hypothetical protein